MASVSSNDAFYYQALSSDNHPFFSVKKEQAISLLCSGYMLEYLFILTFNLSP